MQLRSRNTAPASATARKPLPITRETSKPVSLPNNRFDNFKRTLKGLFDEMDDCRGDGILERERCFHKISKVSKVYIHFRDYLNEMHISNNLPAICVLFKAAFNNGMRILDDIIVKSKEFERDSPLSWIEEKIKRQAVETVSEACSMIYRISKDLSLPESLRV